MKKVRVAIVGCGHLGKWHVEKAISHPDADLVAIVESFDKTREELVVKYPQIRIEKSLEDIISEVDAVIIATPTSTHFSLVEKALKSGKHVFCEKPLTDKLNDSLKLKEWIVREERVIQLGHSERFHEVWSLLMNREDLKDFFNAKVCLNFNRYAPLKGRATDVDVVSDLMIHDLDLLWFFFKETPESVDASGFKISTNKWDHVRVNLKFRSGRNAVITAGRNHVLERREVEFVCAEGTVFVDLLNNEYLVAKAGMKDEDILRINYTKRDHLYEEQALFYQSILNKDKAIVPLEDGIRAVQWISAIQQSLEEGRVISMCHSLDFKKG